MDSDFECIRDSLHEEAKQNTTATVEHVPEIEFNMCLIKERVWALIGNFTFKKITCQIIIELIRFVGLWINQEPSNNWVSDVYSPRNIIIGKKFPYENHSKFRFGSYVEAHEYGKISNNMEEQTVISICLGPTAHFQGSYKTFSLNMGRVVTWKHKIWKIPMPIWVIQHIEALVARERQDIAYSNKPLFDDQFPMITILLPPSMSLTSQKWHRMKMVRTMIMIMMTPTLMKNLRTLL